VSRGTLDRPAADATTAVAHDVRPVMLICDAIPLPIGNTIMHVARTYAERDNRRNLDAAGALAKSVGVRVTQMVFHNPKPVSAALEVTREQRIGLLVFGADRSRLGRWNFRRAARKLREGSPCLVWTNEP